MSKNRSPREVCSMTDGMIRFDGCFIFSGSLTAGGPERRVGIVADDLGLLAEEALDILVGDLDPELIGDRVEHELARNRTRGLLAETCEQLLRRLPRHRQVRVERYATRLDLPREPAQQLARARIHERPGRIDLRRSDERVGDVGAELRLRLLRDLCLQSFLDIRAQLVERVELR